VIEDSEILTSLSLMPVEDVVYNYRVELLLQVIETGITQEMLEIIGMS
jgi:hypothetical protein